MSSRMGLRLATAGALAITLVLLPAFGSAARDRTAATTEFSAQSDKDKDKDKDKKKAQKGQQRQESKPEKKVQRQEFKQEKKVQRQESKPEKKVQRQEFRQEKKVQRQEFRQEKKVQQFQKQGLKKELKFSGKRREFTPKGANAKVVTGAKIRGIPRSGAGRLAIRGQNYSAWRGGYRKRHGNGWRTFVALGTLGVLSIGAAEYYPYAYIDSPEPFCEGLTEDGCQLDWQDVETVEGDVIGQCVAYCPWQ